MSARTDRRGFSLLELMVASAVGLIILVAAMAAFDLQASFSRHTERLLGAQASSGLGLTMMQRDLENSGLRFRGGAQVDGGVNWAAAVRPYDQLGTNIVDLCNNAACTGTLGKVTAPSGSQGGYIAGTDAFEVLLGSRQMDPRRVAAQVGTVGAFGGSTMTITVSPDPFTAQELVPPALGSSAPLLMFWSDDVHCIGRVTASTTVGGAATVTISTVDAKLANAGTPWKPGCPASLMNVDILQYRHRYLVYQSDSSPMPSRTGLHLQSNPFCDPLDGGTVCSTDLGPPMMVAEGIDDMQVAWRVPEGWGPDGGIWCQKSSVESCDFDKLNNSDGIRAAGIIGAQIYLSSHGPEIYKRENEPVPVLFNHTPTPATDNVVRSVMQASVLFRNAVTP